MRSELGVWILWLGLLAGSAQAVAWGGRLEDNAVYLLRRCDRLLQATPEGRHCESPECKATRGQCDRPAGAPAPDLANAIARALAEAAARTEVQRALDGLSNEQQLLAKRVRGTGGRSDPETRAHEEEIEQLKRQILEAQALLLAGRYREAQSSARKNHLEKADFVTADRGANGDDTAGLGGVGGLSWQSQIIDGVAAFLVDRAKAEALLALMTELREKVCVAPPDKRRAVGDGASAVNIDPGRLFPASCALLGASDESELPAIGSTFRAAFASDLEQLAERVIAELLPQQGGFTTSDGHTLLGLTIDLVKRLLHGEPPFDALIAALNRAAGEVAPPDSCASAPLRLKSRLAFAARVLSIAKDAFVALHDPELRQQLIHKSLLGAGCGEPADRLITLGATAAEQVVAARTRFEERRAEGKLAAAFAAYLDGVVGLLRQIVTLLPAGDPAARELSRWLDLVDRLVSIVNAVHVRDYGRVVVELVTLLRETAAILQTPGIVLPQPLLRFASLAAEVASAKSASEVKAAFEAAADPVGGFRSKRVSGRFSVSIASYLGLDGGVELIGGGGRYPAPTLALWAPLGIDATWGTRAGKTPLSVGAYFSVVDLGAVLSFRLTETKEGGATVDRSPQIGFAQIFSPGAFFALGVSRRVPITLGVGACLTPYLRRVTTERGTETQEHALRIQAFLAMDLTLLRLH